MGKFKVLTQFLFLSFRVEQACSVTDISKRLPRRQCFVQKSDGFDEGRLPKPV